MNKTLLTTAAALGIMAASQSSLASDQVCNVVGYNADPDQSVVFSVTNGHGQLDSSYPVKPGETAAIQVGCGEEVLIGATPLGKDEVPSNIGGHNYSGIYTYRGGAVHTGTQISAVFPADFDYTDANKEGEKR